MNNNNIISTEKKNKIPSSKLLIKRNEDLNAKLKGPLNEIDKLSIKKILSEHFLFKDKSPEIINNILEKIEIKNYPISSEIESLDSFYIIKQGKIELINNLGQKSIYIEDETFGEISVIEKKKNNIKVRIIKDSIFFYFKRRNF